MRPKTTDAARQLARAFHPLGINFTRAKVFVLIVAGSPSMERILHAGGPVRR
jgi:hypothetical protein